MKHIFTYLLLWIGCAYIQAMPIYEMAPPEPVPMRSMRVMTGDARYAGVTYAPFTTAMPSEQNAAAEQKSSRPHGYVRKGKIDGADYGQGSQSPIGEPWILALFAILFTLTTIRNKEKHNIITGPSRDHLPRKTQYRTSQNLKLQYQMTKNNSTMKNKPSIQSVQNKLKVSTKSVVNATKVLIPILIFAFLTLGVGQAWGDDGALYNCYFTYNDGSAHSQNTDASGMDNKALGTLTSDLKITAVYLKVWDDWDDGNNNGNHKWTGGQLRYTIDNWANTSYHNPGAWTYGGRSKNSGGNFRNYELQNSSVNWILARTTDPSGNYTLKYQWQVWGNSNANSYYRNPANNQFTYSIAPPALDGSDFTVTPSGLISGTGAEDDPFIIANGSSTTFTVSATQAHSDANSTLWVKFGGNSYSSTTTSGSYAKSASKTSVIIKAKYRNNSASLDGAEVTKTIYYQEQPAGITVAAGSNGTVSIDNSSWGTNKVITPISFGTNYNIYAKGNDHYDFSSWSKSTNSTNTIIANTESANTTVSVSAGAVTTVTANFVEHPYTITIVGGTTASTTAKIATTGTATANPPFGMHFTGWTIPGSNFTLVDGTTSDPTITFNATAAGTITANFAQTHAYVEGRFHITNASRNGVWTNTFSSGNWQEDSRNIEFSYDNENHYYYLHTYATPKELTTEIGGTGSNYYPWFYIKSSPSTSNWTGATVNRPHASGDAYQQLTTAGDANKKLADGTNGSNSFRFNSADESGYVILAVKKVGANPYIYYWLEQTLEYNGNGSDGGSAPASKTYYDKGTSVQAAVNTYTRDGYTFTGWNTKADGGGTAIAENGWHELNANTTLYAQWSEITHTVSVASAGNGTVSPTSVSSIGKTTTSGDITATADPGYYFTNWTLLSGVTAATSYSENSNPIKINATADSKTITANFALQWSVVGDDEIGGWTGDGLTANMLKNYQVVSSKNKGYVDIDLLANKSYKFKVYDKANNKWYGYAAGDNEDNQMFYAEGDVEKATTLADGNRDIYLNTAAGGTYHFKWNLTDKYIAVEYPTSRFFTIGKSIAEAGSLTAVDGESNTIQNGEAISDNGSITFTITTVNTGYEFSGWYSNEECTTPYTHNGATIVINKSAKTLQLTNVTADLTTVYAKFVPKTYAITLNQTGAKTEGSTSATATYNAVLPAITKPTPADGYAFMGYFTGENGAGTQFTDNNGAWLANIPSYTDEDKKWIYDGTETLYAYFEKAEITAIGLNATIFEPVAAEEEGHYVTANPTVVPSPAGNTKICWALLYDNNNPVTGYEPEPYTEGGTKPNQVRFSIAGLAAGGYKIKATLRTGTSCEGGDVLSTYEKSFTVASSFIVTIVYKDSEGNTIASSTSSPGKATEWTSVTAPDDIFGYTFSTWVLGDGITANSVLTTREDFQFKATFNGTLTAQYTKNKMVFLKNTIGWSAPFVYFYKEGGYWNAGEGAGCNGDACLNKNYAHAMTNIPGTDIWYFDYSRQGWANQVTRFMAFTDGNKSDHKNFNGVDVIYVTSYTHGFNEGTPMFVTLAKEDQNCDAVGGASYYSRGYWTNYLGANTGYTIVVYNSDGTELKRQRLTSIHNDQLMTMKATLDLDASAIYKYALVRDNNISYGNTGTMTYDARTQNWAFTQGTEKCTLKTTAAGKYVFTLSYAMDGTDKTTYQLRINVEYPAAVNDFQILYNDNAEWSLGSAHSANWVHPSRVIRARAGGVDTISFFVSKGTGITAQLKARKVNSINASTGAITWGTLNIAGAASQSLTVDSAAVWNFKVTQGAAGVISSIEKIGPYTGNYYIRCNALNSNWDNYTTDGDHRMTYSSFSESAENSFGEKYSHYKAKWCPRGTNIAFCIANDYSPCITDTLKQDVGGPAFNNLNADGTLKDDGNGAHSGDQAYLDPNSANVRFMWNRKTNKISRAYVSAATSGLARFLVLQGSGTTDANIFNSAGNTIAATANLEADATLLSDNQNWIYEVTVQANPSALVKLYANYCGHKQWFRGAEGTPFEKNTNSIEILGGTASSSKYSVRVIYDFKTNRLVCAWVPTGASETIGTDVTVNADVMVVREHQGSAQCITFNNSAKMTGVKTVYGVMKFNRWILNNRANPNDEDPAHCADDAAISANHRVLDVDAQKSIYERSHYYISFPFDVRLNDVFGFGTYWDEWYIEYYDGLNRAKNGYWIDSPSNWKYVTPAMKDTFVLRANQGYIFGLDLDYMDANNYSFWTNKISNIEMYFPSTVELSTLQSTEITIPALNSEYQCTINRSGPDGDRRVKDSYWRCIGVPSLDVYDRDLSDGTGTITWKTDYTWQEDESEFPFIYMWNKNDNTLTPQSTSRFTFQPMHAYLVQHGKKIVWTAVSAKPVSIVARQKAENHNYEWCLTLHKDSVFMDRTYIRLSDNEQVTDSFDFGQDLSKEFNKKRSNIYSFIGTNQAAANSMPFHDSQTTVVPVGVTITAAGDYTFSIPEGTDGIGVTLVDNETGVRTSLSALDYTVSLGAGTHDQRFTLEISPIQNTPTGIDEVPSDQVPSTKARKVMIDGVLYIVKDGKMYDARGARVR